MQTAIIRFAFVRFIFVSDVFRDIYPGFPSRRNSASCGQLNRIMGLSPALLALTRKYHYPHTFHCRLWLLSKGLNIMIVARSSRSWRMVHIAAETSYRRVINVLAELIFCCQDSIGEFLRSIFIDFPLHYLLATKLSFVRDLFFVFI